MIRLVTKLLVYFGLFILIMLIGWLPELSYTSLAILCMVLALVNTFIRPIISALALPLGLLTLGITGIFVNLLTLVIANAIAGHTLALTFWPLLLLAIAIMLLDNTVIMIRNKQKYRQLDA